MCVEWARVIGEMHLSPTHPRECSGSPALEAHGRTGPRVDEAEYRCVQRQTVDRISGGAVGAIADHRVARCGQLDADLVTAAGPKRDVEHRHCGATLAHAVARDGEPGAGFSRASRTDAERPTLEDLALERAGL